MTALLVAAFVLGASAATAAAACLWHRWAEAHHWNVYRVEAGNFRALCDQCDHLERHNRRLTDEQTELREGVGELLDTVAHQQHVIDQLTEPAPTYADFAYGANR